jgi:hypothetical protein
MFWDLGLHRRKGVRSLVLESSPALRASWFALGTWKNAFRALDALGRSGSSICISWRTLQSTLRPIPVSVGLVVSHI